MKKLFFLLILLAGAGAVWKFYYQDRPPVVETPKGPETTVVRRGELRVVVESTGRVVANREIEIKCKASGEVILLPLDVNDTVKKGDILVRLDPEGEERLVKQADAALSVSQARLEQARLAIRIGERNLQTERSRAETALKSSQASAQEAKARIERVEKLLDKKLASDEEYEAARSAHALALANLESARARMEDLGTQDLTLDSLRQDVKIAEAQVQSNEFSLSDARQRLQETTVFSPADAVMASRNVQEGQIIASGINNVGGGTTVMTLVDLSRIFVLASVDESDIGRVETGQPTSITVDAHPSILFPGRVTRVATKGAAASNVVTFEVKIEVEGRRIALLRPEMTANIEIVAVDKQNAILVPVTALNREKRKQFVTVLSADGKEDKRFVEVGASDGETAEILENLAEGERVVIQEGRSRWQKGAGTERRSGGQDQMMKMRMMQKGSPR